MALVAGALTLVLVGIVAFVSDFGMAYANKRLLQNGADAAVLAAAQAITEAAPPRATCAEMLGHAPAGRVEAEKIFRENASDPSADLAPGASGFTVECVPGLNLVVSATGTQRSRAFFGGVFGVDAVPIAESAKAVVSPVKDPSGLRPFGVCDVDANLLVANPTLPKTLVFGKQGAGSGGGESRCALEPGSWGLLDLDGPRGGRGGPNGLKHWVEFGFSGVIPDLTAVSTQTGNLGGLRNEMNAILGQEIALPVFDKLNERPGNNLTYNVTGFVVVQVCRFDFAGSANGQHLCQDGTEWTATVAANGGTGGTTNYLQVRYVDYLAVGEADLSCELGSATCDYGARVVKLAD